MACFKMVPLKDMFHNLALLLNAALGALIEITSFWSILPCILPGFYINSYHTFLCYLN